MASSGPDGGIRRGEMASSGPDGGIRREEMASSGSDGGIRREEMASSDLFRLSSRQSGVDALCQLKGKGSMANTSFDARLAQGEAILQRLAAAPATLKPAARVFAALQKKLAAATRAVDAARAVRDAALHAVGDADDALDPSVYALADRLVGAHLGVRLRPLAAFTRYSLSDLATLPYALEAKEVLAMTAKIVAKKPAADVKKACAECAKNARAVQGALTKLTKPDHAYRAALGARDDVVADWEKARRTLQRRAAAILDSDRAARALVAKADAMQAPRRAKRRANGATGEAAGTGAEAGGAGGPDAPAPGADGAPSGTDAPVE
jgi:hypothetical protein